MKWAGLRYLTITFALAGCSSDHDHASNQAPSVEITSGPISGDTTSYSVSIAWTGEDPDGSIARFEFTIDPNPVFSEDEIAQGGPGIFALPIEGRNGSPDTTRITKPSGAFFDWIHIKANSRDFSFSASQAESSQARPTGRFFGMHAVYVRAIDNDAGASIPAKLAFTAETIAPTSRFVRPDVTRELGDFGPSVTLEWTGSDPDQASGEELKYEMKLIRLDDLSPPIPILQATPFVLIHDPTHWVPLGASSGPLTLPLSVPGEYLLGIRALDAAGAVEPFLDFGRNAFKFQAFPSGGTPNVILLTAAGRLAFRGTGAPVDVELVTGVDLDVEVECSAERYGETCDTWRWGLDLADRDAPEGWSDWTTQAHLPEIRFPQSGMHVFYLDARDKAGGTTRCEVILHVLDAPFDREVLLVDDSFDNLDPRDSENDAFWGDLVSYYVQHSDLPADQFFTYAVHGAGDRGNLQPSVPQLADLLRYRLLIWDAKGVGYNGDSALIRSTFLSPRLYQYLNAGGKVWLSTNSLGDQLECPYPNVCADLNLGDNSEFSFCRYFGLCTDSIQRPATARDAMVEAVPYPDIDLPTLVVNPSGGMVRSEAILHPILESTIPDFVGDIDSVFAHGAAGPRMDPPMSSRFEGKPVAIRWHDPDPHPKHGRTEWFGFPPYNFDLAGTRETFRKTLDWFREEEPTPSPQSASHTRP